MEIVKNLERRVELKEKIFLIKRTLNDADKRLLEHLSTSSVRRHGIRIDVIEGEDSLKVRYTGIGPSPKYEEANYRLKFFLRERALI